MSEWPRWGGLFQKLVPRLASSTWTFVPHHLSTTHLSNPASCTKEYRNGRDVLTTIDVPPQAPSSPLKPQPQLRAATMVVYSLIIINKAGGLVYQRDFHEGLHKLSVNDYLVLAGTFHGVHAITRSLTPSALRTPPASRTGLEVLETALFRLTCFQTHSGTKFLLFTEPHQPNVDVTMRRIYELYADYVMKNPFYQLEMPVRCEAFERFLGAYVRARQ